MITESDDRAAITSARSAYNARKTESAIVAWICSPAWFDASLFHGSERKRGTVYHAGVYRPTFAREITGEIEC